MKNEVNTVPEAGLLAKCVHALSVTKFIIIIVMNLVTLMSCTYTLAYLSGQGRRSLIGFPPGRPEIRLNRPNNSVQGTLSEGKGL
jgi:hypothetical protein